MVAVESVPLRSGTSAEWGATTLILGVGELGLDTDAGVIRVGDGETPFADLPDFGGGGGADLSPAYFNKLNGLTLTGSYAPLVFSNDSGYPIRDDLFTLNPAGDTMTCVAPGAYDVNVYVLGTVSGASPITTPGGVELVTSPSVNDNNAGPAWNYVPPVGGWIGANDQHLFGSYSFPQVFEEGDTFQLLAKRVLVGTTNLGTSTIVINGGDANLMLTRVGD